MWETIGSAYPCYYPDAVVDAFIELHDAVAISANVAAGKVIVAERAGKIVGTGAFDERYISRLFVAVGFQGRGIEFALLDRIESEVARSSDVSAVESSLPACSLYERCGCRTAAHGTWAAPSSSTSPPFFVLAAMEKAL